MKFKIVKKTYLLIVISLISGNIGAAGVDAKKFENPEHEQIYNTLVSQLRCLVCQNQTIADSNAALAKDLRRQVFEMIQQGKTEQEIKTYMLTRYGDFVLYKPPFKLKTGLLWLGPAIFLLIGLLVIFFYSRRRKKQEITELDVTEKEKIRQLLDKGDKFED